MARGVFLKKNGERYYPAPYMPIGSIYLTVSNVNPSTYFGGTWEKLSGGYIYCAASLIEKTTYTGWGTQSHTLTVNQIPAHNHDVRQRNNSPTPIASMYSTNYTGGQQEYNWVASSKMINTGNTENIFTMNKGGGQGHTHNIATIDVFMWKRIA